MLALRSITHAFVERHPFHGVMLPCLALAGLGLVVVVLCSAPAWTRRHERRWPQRIGHGWKDA
jgi:hypothetical protein